MAKVAIKLITVLLWSWQLAVAASPTPTTPHSTSAQKPSPIKTPPTAPTKPSPTTHTKPSPVAPTKKPPTKPAPTKPAPTSKLFSISTNNSTYAFNTTVTVTYTSQQPRRDDFIGIFPVSTPTTNLTKGLFWLWVCNQQGNVCSSAEKKGTVVFGQNGPPSAWGIHWPLPAGEYRAYLLRDASNPPYTAIAQSEVFKVVLSFKDALEGAKSAIAALVRNDTNLIPQFLRLIFHDCVGGCDGCIDLSNPVNSGLAGAINTLTVVTDAFANNNTGLSRADVWSMSAIVATDVANKGKITKPINFTYNWFGRVDCEVANKVCFNHTKHVVPCAPTAGPDRNVPGPNLNTTGFFSFFEQTFNFTAKQAVAAMGAHSVGRLFRQNSGIDGPDGWEINNQQVHSEYYEALLGSANSKSDAAEIFSKSPRWDHMFLNNANFSRPNRFFWRLNVVNKNLSMTNADIAMVRDLNNNNMDPVTGKVSCAYNPTLGEKPLCPLADSVSIVQGFLDNDVWLAEFKSVLDLISTNGYIRKSCSDSVCPLVLKKPQ